MINVMIEKPAILITPKDFQVDQEEIRELSAAIGGANSGQVIYSSFAVQLYHLIDGLWVESGDLHKVLVKAVDDAKAGD